MPISFPTPGPFPPPSQSSSRSRVDDAVLVPDMDHAADPKNWLVDAATPGDQLVFTCPNQGATPSSPQFPSHSLPLSPTRHPDCHFSRSAPRCCRCFWIIPPKIRSLVPDNMFTALVSPPHPPLSPLSLPLVQHMAIPLYQYQDPSFATPPSGTGFPLQHSVSPTDSSSITPRSTCPDPDELTAAKLCCPPNHTVEVLGLGPDQTDCLLCGSGGPQPANGKKGTVAVQSKE